MFDGIGCPSVCEGSAVFLGHQRPLRSESKFGSFEIADQDRHCILESPLSANSAGFVLCGFAADQFGEIPAGDDADAADLDGVHDATHCGVSHPGSGGSPAYQLARECDWIQPLTVKLAYRGIVVIVVSCISWGHFGLCRKQNDTKSRIRPQIQKQNPRRHSSSVLLLQYRRAFQRLKCGPISFLKCST